MKKEFIASWNNHSTQTIETEGLTENEVKAMIASRNNEFNDVLEERRCGTWNFTVQENSGISAKSYKGVVASLIKKGLVNPINDKDPVNERQFALTVEGAKRFSDYDGKDSYIEAEKTVVDKIATKKNVTLYTFTGMSIGTYEANLVCGLWEVVTKKDTLRFDYYGRQVGDKNPKFSNMILF